MGIKSRVRAICERQLNKNYLKTLGKCHVEVDYATVKALQEKDVAAFDLEKASFCLFVRDGGKLSEGALGKIESFFANHEECQILFGNEECQGNPIFRGEFGAEDFLLGKGLGSVIAVRKSLKEDLPLRTSFENTVEIRESLTALLLKANAFTKGKSSVCHIDEMLYESDKANDDSEVISLEEAFKNPIFTGDMKTCEKLSVIIPSKDHPEILTQCITSLIKAKIPMKLEIVVVDNGSNAENKRKVEELLGRSEVGAVSETIYHHEEMAFNFSHMCNIGAELATGDVYLFLNDDIESVTESWLEVMWKLVQVSHIGAVGCKLYYPRSKKIQHVGVQNLLGGPVHKYQFMEEGENPFVPGMKNVLAVTGACLMVRKRAFYEAGAFDEGLTVAYNDVALCMSLHRLGYKNVVLGEEYLFHHESLSRGNDLTREKLERLKGERNRLYDSFPEYRGYDPYYPRQLSHELGDADTKPRFFVTEKNVQKNTFTILEKLELVPTEGLECFFDPKEKTGYGVVTFENNALFNRFLILTPRSGGRFYKLKLTSQYCEETAFWKQEQPNCALCGFDVSKVMESLGENDYRIGYLAKYKLGRKYFFTWMEEES